MKRTGFFYEVHSEVSLTWAEFLVLEEAASTHYDATCRGIATAGFLRRARADATWEHASKTLGLQGDALFDAVSTFDAESTVQPPAETVLTMRLKWRDLDLLCKIAESPTLVHRGFASLWYTLVQMLRQMGIEQERINGVAPDAS